MKKIVFGILCLFIVGQAIAQQYKFQNQNLSFEERVDNLISLLTLEEKAALMKNSSMAIDRLGIPYYDYWNECLHGVGRAGKATVFPQAIGLGATFDTKLIYRVALAISDEARAKHNEALKKDNRQRYTGLTFWTPNINIFRDPRWGRGQETYGEDPYLTSIIGTAFVKGLQGDDRKYLKTSACAKHFAVHSGPETTRHYVNVKPTQRDLYETYLPAFKALSDAKVESVMCAYNRLFDKPCCGSNSLLNDILREKWGFEGHIVSDCGALDDIWARHKVVDTKAEAAGMAANAGLNLNCGGIYSHLPEAVKKGYTTEEAIDIAIKPLLMTRFKLGLMDKAGSTPFDRLTSKVVNSQKHIDLTYEAALKSIVLLKNKNNVLPLNQDKMKKVFVIGPTAYNGDVLVGNYNGFAGNMVTMLEGMINKSDAGTVVDYSRGCLLNTPDKYHGVWAAGGSDAIVVGVGLSRMLEGEEGDAMLSDHGGDRLKIELPENQVELVRKMRKVAGKKPLIVVVTGGSAIVLGEVAELADAVLFAWYPGEQGGNAIADVIYGNKVPSGRLPVTFYKSTSDLPDFEDYSMKNRTYKYFNGEPLYEFGYGLSYSNFEYSNLKTNKDKFRKKETIELSFTIKNSGKYNADEVSQVYFRNLNSKVEQPLKSLIGVERREVSSGSATTISFSIPISQLGWYNEKKEDYYVNKGKYEIQVGASSKDIRLKKVIRIR